MNIKLDKKFYSRLKVFLICSTLGIVLALGLSWFFKVYFNDYINIASINSAFKFRQKYYPEERNKSSNDIVVVLFDDDSNRVLGKFFPYDRKEVAKLINFLSLAGARAVLFDIMFNTKNKPSSDEELIKSVAQSGRVYLGSKLIHVGEEKVADKGNSIDRFCVNLKIQNLLNMKNPFLFSSKPYLLETPFKQLAETAKGIGFFTVPSDMIKTRANLVYCDLKKKCFSSLPFSYYLDYLNEKNIVAYLNKFIEVNNKQIPVDEENYFLVNWFGGINDTPGVFIYNSYSVYYSIKSYEEILKLSKKYNLSPKEVFDGWYNDTNELFKDNEEIYDPDVFKDKIVIVGVSSSGAQDFILTPFGNMPGVFIHAFILDSLLRENFITPVNKIINIIILVLFCLITSFTVLYASSKSNVFYILLPVLYLLLFTFIFLNIFGMYNVLINWTVPTFGIILTYFFTLIFYFFIEGKDKKLIKRAMSNYLSPQIMKMVLDNPELLKPEAVTRKNLTVFFFDIRSFTTISESVEPEIVAKMLNEYHSEIINIIFNNKGTLDKIIGDAVMAFWNAPVDVEDHPYLAVKSALEVKEKLQDINIAWGERLKYFVNFGIGINTQEVVVGNIGSEKFMDYTVIGDGVNLASRLEGLNKSYGTNIIISEYTYHYLRDKIEVRYLGKVTVKGKTEETDIYELVNLKVGC
ncbi:MAG: adenylate/guanylate cyclase domain-containing protein [Cyanobacteriota bacterium]